MAGVDFSCPSADSFSHKTLKFRVDSTITLSHQIPRGDRFPGNVFNGLLKRCSGDRLCILAKLLKSLVFVVRIEVRISTKNLNHLQQQ
ncbi:MAG: hypothetical protein KME49_10525 [Brasilonema octagenarum HA4186-MV1]|jgi:hypothetical protein|nr:hypothetical protein [Brasilonema octagenarum HA4186-MV1]